MVGSFVISLVCQEFSWFSPSNFPSLLSHSSEYKVSISGTDVVLTCPPAMLQGEIHWEKDNQEIKGENEEQLILKNFSEMENSGYYACYTGQKSNDVKSHYLYLRARGNVGGSFQKGILNDLSNPTHSPLVSQGFLLHSILGLCKAIQHQYFPEQIKNQHGVVWITSVSSWSKISTSQETGMRHLDCVTPRITI